ncbi:ArsA-related P-loop ATPase [Paraliobacillus zengyii]|uniref:ArsA-related P-loop ATPase n=1 Tax=Paraliobacillus zengyii TaxID=2213194 RepID=UPI001F53F900|nr:ArsA-related P-loop ATPase [Paraliobacillus zengyii]
MLEIKLATVLNFLLKQGSKNKASSWLTVSCKKKAKWVYRSGACTRGIATFDQFTNLLADHTIVETYDLIVIDTAPTGHTLLY